MPWLLAAPLAVVVGLGATSQEHRDPGDTDSIAPALDVLAGYRLPANFTLAARGRLSRYVDHDEFFGNSGGDKYDTILTSLDVALAVQYEHGRFWIAPWIGRHYATGRQQDTLYSGCMRVCEPLRTIVTDVSHPALTAYGVLAGVDVVVDGSNRLAAFVDAQSSTTEMSLGVSYNYSALTFGIAYRR